LFKQEIPILKQLFAERTGRVQIGRATFASCVSHGALLIRPFKAGTEFGGKLDTQMIEEHL
jgi:hypothetical protein